MFGFAFPKVGFGPAPNAALETPRAALSCDHEQRDIEQWTSRRDYHNRRSHCTPPGPIFRARLLRNEEAANTKRYVSGQLWTRSFQRHPSRHRHSSSCCGAIELRKSVRGVCDDSDDYGRYLLCFRRHSIPLSAALQQPSLPSVVSVGEDNNKLGPPSMSASIDTSWLHPRRRGKARGLVMNTHNNTRIARAHSVRTGHNKNLHASSIRQTLLALSRKAAISASMENFDSFVPPALPLAPVGPPTAPLTSPAAAPPSVPASPCPLHGHLAATAAQNAHANGRKHAGWRSCHAFARLAFDRREEKRKGVADYCCARGHGLASEKTATRASLSPRRAPGARDTTPSRLYLHKGTPVKNLNNKFRHFPHMSPPVSGAGIISILSKRSPELGVGGLILNRRQDRAATSQKRSQSTSDQTQPTQTRGAGGLTHLSGERGHLHREMLPVKQQDPSGVAAAAPP